MTAICFGKFWGMVHLFFLHGHSFMNAIPASFSVMGTRVSGFRLMNLINKGPHGFGSNMGIDYQSLAIIPMYLYTDRVVNFETHSENLNMDPAPELLSFVR